MTLLMTKCPFCGENFMVADTEDMEGTCMLCSRSKAFTKEEISDAETRRDELSERYIPEMQRMFESKDAEAIAPLAKKVASEGVSSWYAWFFIGWHEMMSGRTEKGFDDFSLAVSFLDEESFDEFYSLVMDACVDSLTDACAEGRRWNTGHLSLLEFSSIMDERFHDIMDASLEEDLTTKIGYCDGVAESGSACLNFAFEAADIAISYSCNNMFLPDHGPVLEAASWAALSMASKAEDLEGSRSRNASKIRMLSEFLDRVGKTEGAILRDYGPEKMGFLCDLWIGEEDDMHGDILERAFEDFVGYMLSDGRNKGRKKKMEDGLARYEASIREALADERLGAPKEESGDGWESEYAGKECPECGEFVPSGPGGILECGCGFRGRIVTPAIEDLPDGIEELRAMARESLKGSDSELLNNLGECILDKDGDEWLGHLALGRSCVLDGNLPVATVMLSEGSSTLGRKSGADEFCGIAKDILAEGMASASREDDHLALFYMPPLILNAESMSKGGFLGNVFGRIMELDGMKTALSIAVCTETLPKLILFSMCGNPYLPIWSETLGKSAALLERAESNLRNADCDGEMKSMLGSNIRKDIEFVSYFADEISNRISSSSPKEMDDLKEKWKGSEGLMELALDMAQATIWGDSEYKPESKEVQKAKKTADRFLDSFMGRSRS